MKGEEGFFGEKKEKRGLRGKGGRTHVAYWAGGWSVPLVLCGRGIFHSGKERKGIDAGKGRLTPMGEKTRSHPLLRKNGKDSLLEKG